MPVVAAGSDPLSAPQRCVIAEDGRIIGFHDVDYSDRDDRLYRSAMRGGDLVNADPEALQPVTRGEAGRIGGGNAPLLTRYLEAEFPDKVVLHAVASLLVVITGAPADPAAKGFVVPAGLIDIHVQARKGFAIEGPGELRVEVGSDETLPVQFRLRADAIGQWEVRVLAFRDGQPLTAVTIKPVVVEAGDEAAETTTQRGALAPAHARAPDLMLLIEETTINDKSAFAFRLSAPYLDQPHNLTRFGPITLETEPLGYSRRGVAAAGPRLWQPLFDLHALGLAAVEDGLDDGSAMAAER